MSGKYVAFIDPHRTTVSSSETQPAGTKKKLTKVFEHVGHVSTFHGIFDCDKHEASYGATLFRFPLRLHNSHSKISSKVSTVEDLNQSHFASLKFEAPFLLLFLNSVKKISLYEMGDQHDFPKLLFSVTAESKSRDLLKNIIPQRKLSESSLVHLDCITVLIEDLAAERTSEHHWLVLNVIGSSNAEIMALSEKLSTFPWVGLAAQIPVPALDTALSYECSSESLAGSVKDDMLRSLTECRAMLPADGCTGDTNGRAFCFLPLPIVTALPIHVHGYFAVNDNRRGIKWPSHDDKSTDALWNKALVCNLVAPAYSLLLSSKSALFFL
jgi:sacsin